MAQPDNMAKPRQFFYDRFLRVFSLVFRVVFSRAA
jgi:hypothetical protein